MQPCIVAPSRLQLSDYSSTFNSPTRASRAPSCSPARTARPPSWRREQRRSSCCPLTARPRGAAPCSSARHIAPAALGAALAQRAAHGAAQRQRRVSLRRRLRGDDGLPYQYPCTPGSFGCGAPTESMTASPTITRRRTSGFHRPSPKKDWDNHLEGHRQWALTKQKVCG